MVPESLRPHLEAMGARIYHHPYGSSYVTVPGSNVTFRFPHPQIEPADFVTRADGHHDEHTFVDAEFFPTLDRVRDQFASIQHRDIPYDRNDVLDEIASGSRELERHTEANPNPIKLKVSQYPIHDGLHQKPSRLGTKVTMEVPGHGAYWSVTHAPFDDADESAHVIQGDTLHLARAALENPLEDAPMHALLDHLQEMHGGPQQFARAFAAALRRSEGAQRLNDDGPQSPTD